MSSQAKYFIDESKICLMTNKFKILSEESRLRILYVLQDGEKTVSEIVEETGYLQANVSKQLKILLDANILSLRTKGKHHYYGISDTQLLTICKIICTSNKE